MVQEGWVSDNGPGGGGHIFTLHGSRPELCTFHYYIGRGEGHNPPLNNYFLFTYLQELQC